MNLNHVRQLMKSSIILLKQQTTNGRDLLIKSRDIQTVEINGAGNNHMRVHRSEI
jgi:hypothetical protein